MAFLKGYKKSRVEQKAYRRLVSEKTKLAARQAYADEAVKVARERARAKARRPSIFGIARERVGGGLRSYVAGTSKRTSPVRRVKRRTIRSSPRKAMRRVMRRTARKRYSPSKVSRKRTITQPSVPQTLDQAIYGGY